MLQCGPTVVGCCFDGVAQPALTSSEIMNRSSKCFAKITVGFIRRLMDRELLGCERLIIQDTGGEVLVISSSEGGIAS
jgi:hypothetical protein